MDVAVGVAVAVVGVDDDDDHNHNDDDDDDDDDDAAAHDANFTHEVQAAACAALQQNHPAPAASV